MTSFDTYTQYSSALRNPRFDYSDIEAPTMEDIACYLPDQWSRHSPAEEEHLPIFGYEGSLGAHLAYASLWRAVFENPEHPNDFELLEHHLCGMSAFVTACVFEWFSHGDGVGNSTFEVDDDMREFLAGVLVCYPMTRMVPPDGSDSADENHERGRECLSIFDAVPGIALMMGFVENAISMEVIVDRPRRGKGNGNGNPITRTAKATPELFAVVHRRVYDEFRRWARMFYLHGVEFKYVRSQEEVPKWHVPARQKLDDEVVEMYSRRKMPLIIMDKLEESSFLPSSLCKAFEVFGYLPDDCDEIMVAVKNNTPEADAKMRRMIEETGAKVLGDVVNGRVREDDNIFGAEYFRTFWYGAISFMGDEMWHYAGGDDDDRVFTAYRDGRILGLVSQVIARLFRNRDDDLALSEMNERIRQARNAKSSLAGMRSPEDDALRRRIGGYGTIVNNRVTDYLSRRGAEAVERISFGLVSVDPASQLAYAQDKENRERGIGSYLIESNYSKEKLATVPADLAIITRFASMPDGFGPATPTNGEQEPCEWEGLWETLILDPSLLTDEDADHDAVIDMALDRLVAYMESRGIDDIAATVAAGVPFSDVLA